MCKQVPLPWTADKKKAAFYANREFEFLQFVALHKDLAPAGAEWPAIKAKHHYWTEATQYVKDTAKTGHW